MKRLTIPSFDKDVDKSPSNDVECKKQTTLDHILYDYIYINSRKYEPTYNDINKSGLCLKTKLGDERRIIKGHPKIWGMVNYLNCANGFMI